MIRPFIFKLLLCMILGLLASCRAIHMIYSQDVTTHRACDLIMLESGKVFMTVKLDGQDKRFLFDTGATASILTDSAAVGFKSKHVAKFGRIKAANGEKSVKGLLQADMRNALFESENKMLAYLQLPTLPCESTQPYSGIIGMDFFFEDHMALKLDFTQNAICNLSQYEMRNFVRTENYQRLKSECHANQIYVFLTIDGKEQKFKLDTGYNGSIVMPSGTVTLSQLPTAVYDGSLYNTAAGKSSGQELFYEVMPVILGTEHLQALVSVSGSIKAQNMGMGLMKGYDWIIDYNNNAVYIKKNKLPISAKLPVRLSYAVFPVDGYLQVLIKNKNVDRYKIGDKIHVVNRLEITQQNLCETMKMLNSADNWDAFQIELAK